MLATDKDAGISGRVGYNIDSEEQCNVDGCNKGISRSKYTFEVGDRNGSVTTRRLLSSFQNHRFKLNVIGTDDGGLFGSSMLRVGTSPLLSLCIH